MLIVDKIDFDLFVSKVLSPTGTKLSYDCHRRCVGPLDR